MKTKFHTAILILLAIAWPLSTPWASEADADATALLLAQNIKMNLAPIAGSVKALADEYVRLYDQTPVMPEQDRKRWLARSFSNKQTVQFHPFTTGPEPEFQAPQPAYLYYHGKDLSPDIWHEFNVFTRLAPMLKLTYDTFSDSWVYLTTKKGAFLIYPYLPLDEAVHNYPPTEQVYYTAADFKNRSAGWSPPYLDLVGAGMMVTVSYPIYRQDELLGVFSRDITLTQLAVQTLEPVTDTGMPLICLIIDKDGMAIATNQAEGMKEINTINNKAKIAVLYYCQENKLPRSINAGARSSSVPLYNLAGQQTLEAAKSAPDKPIWHFTLEDGDRQYRTSATRIESTGWFVITLQP